jgi:hypothetical protein
MMVNDSKRRTLFRYLCLLTAVANIGGNVLILLFYRPILSWVGAPLPVDIFSFTFVCGFSFTAGVLAWIVFCNPERNRNLLVALIVSKGIYAALTFYFYYAGELHWFYRVFGVWDSTYAFIFLLFLIHLASPDLTVLNSGKILPGGPGPRAKKVLVLFYSLTNNGKGAIDRVTTGLEAEGYTVTKQVVVPKERELFTFPFQQRLAFVRIMIRAILRVPAKIEPLRIKPDHDFDLIVVESQTWFIGISAPVEAIFQDPVNRGVFAGRDVAVVNVCRGLWRRPQAQLVRRVESYGGRIVGVRAFANPGREPIRVFSLFFFLGAGAPGKPAWLKRVLTPQHISEDALGKLELFGRTLAKRPAASLHDIAEVA